MTKYHNFEGRWVPFDNIMILTTNTGVLQGIVKDVPNRCISADEQRRYEEIKDEISLRE